MAFKRVTCQTFGAAMVAPGNWSVEVKGTLEFEGDNETIVVKGAKDEDQACIRALEEYTLKRERAQGVPV